MHEDIVDTTCLLIAFIFDLISKNNIPNSYMYKLCFTSTYSLTSPISLGRSKRTSDKLMDCSKMSVHKMRLRATQEEWERQIAALTIQLAWRKFFRFGLVSLFQFLLSCCNACCCLLLLFVVVLCCYFFLGFCLLIHHSC